MRKIVKSFASTKGQ